MAASATTLPSGPYWMVDDEVELVRSTVSMLARELGAHQVRGSIDPCEVAGWIDHERPTALITDVRMPGLTGLELVSRLHERWGPVPVVVLTAFPTAQVIDDARAGRFAYLPKPFAFEALRDALLRICRQPAASAFSGAIAVSMLGEVVQLYGLSNRTGILQVQSPSGSGDIGFEGGRVVDARAGDFIGADAFNAILSWASGSFTWLTTAPVEHTINQGLSELLLDAYRLRDEAAGYESTASSAGLEFDLEAEVDVPAPAAPNNVQDTLNRLKRVDGFVSAALYDLEAQQVLAALGDEGLVPLASTLSGHAEVVNAERNTIDRLKLDDSIEDIVITLRNEYHLLRLCRREPRLLFFLALERRRANLAMARYVMSDVERDIVV